MQSLVNQPQLVDQVLNRMMDGEILSAICREVGFSAGAFHMLANRDERFREKFARARLLSAHALADDVVRLADECTDPAQLRITENRCTQRKWLAGKYNSAVYGDKPQDVNVTISLRDLIKASVTIEHEEFATNSMADTPSADLLPKD